MMSYKLVEQQRSVKSFGLRGGKLYSLTSDMQVSNTSGLDLTKIGTKHVGEIFIIDPYLIWQDGRGRSAVYHLDEEEIVFSNSNDEVSCTFRRIDLLSKNALVAAVRKNGQKQLCFFDVNQRNFTEMQREVKYSIASGDLLLNSNREASALSSVSFDGEEHWNFPVSGKMVDVRGDEQDVTFGGILGVHNGLLWIWISSGALVGLDQKTGEVVQSVGLAPSNSDEEFEYGGSMQIDAETSSLIGLWNNFYIEIDLNDPNLSVRMTDISASLASQEISVSFRSYTYPFDREHMYFCDDRQGKIGLFDRVKKEVVWSHALEMEHDGIAQILEVEYADDRWYVLDRNETLHVFEKES